MLIGIDFDNTIVNYDKLFFQVAIDKKIIPVKIRRKKISIKAYLLKKGLVKKWKILQSEVYGKNLSKAKPYNGFLKALEKLKKKKVKIKIVSHKTLNPYYGKKINLHKISKKWFEKKIIHACGKNAKDIEIFFELTEKDKIKRIKKLGCTHFIDDLDKILRQLPRHVKKILFLPNNETKKVKKNIKIIKSWNELFTKKVLN